MDITRVLNELYSERDQINEAIAVLQRMGVGGKRGAPKWMMAARVNSASHENDPDPTARKKRNFSEEAREKIAEAQRKRWQAVREKRAHLEK